MDLAYIEYLHSSGIDPAPYVEMQAHYLKFLETRFAKPNKNLLNKSRHFYTKNESLIPKGILQHRPKPKNPITTNSKSQTFNEIPKSQDLISYNNKPLKHLSENQDYQISEEKASCKLIETNHSKSGSLNIISPTNKNIPKKQKVFEAFTRESCRKIVEDREKLKSTSEKLIKTKEKDKSPCVRENFLKKGQGSLCCKPGFYIIPTKTERFDSKSLKKSRSEENINDDTKKSLRLSTNTQESSPKSTQDNARFAKMLKDIREKIKKIDKEAEEFYKMRKRELKSLEKWKNEEMNKVVEEKEKTLKKIRDKQGTIKEITKLNIEIQDLKQVLNQKNQAYNDTMQKLQMVASCLKQSNFSLKRQISSSPKLKKPSNSPLRKSSIPLKLQKSPCRTTENSPDPRPSASQKAFEVPKLKLNHLHLQNRNKSPQIHNKSKSNTKL